MSEKSKSMSPTAFVDTSGRTWVVTITVWHQKQVKASTGVDLFHLIDDQLKGLAELLNDPGSFVDVLWVLVREQGEKSAVTDEQFGRSLGGDSLESAQSAFVEALTNFFPSARARENLRKILAVVRATTDATIAEIEKKLDEISCSASVTNTPGSPVSIPAQ